MLMVIVIVSLMVLIAYPKVSSAMITTNVRGARTTLANMFAKARTVATSGSRRTAVRFNGNQVYVTAAPRMNPGAGTIDTVGAVENLNAVYGVSVSAGADSIGFDPRGIRGIGAAAVTITVAKNGHTESVVVNSMGKVQ